MLPTIAQLQADLAAGRTTSRALTEAALQRIADPAGEGPRTFTQVYQDQALAAARASDALRAAGQQRSMLEGLPISVKDLFDVAGYATTAGSAVLRDAPPARAHATIVQRLLRAGAIVVGRTNMTEFAFSGLGLNPHYGTPRNPWGREQDAGTGRIPGGSSSGAAVAVTDGMCVAAIGTDTGGSVRIPAALCGLTGFKPTAARVPLQGCLPLSPTLDSIGPLAASVQCCATVDAILSGEDGATVSSTEGTPHSSYRPGRSTHHPRSFAPDALRLAVVTDTVLDGADTHVRTTFTHSLQRLERAGVRLHTIALPEFARLPELHRHANLPTAESWHWHRTLLQQRGHDYDPRVAARIQRGRDMLAADYLELLHARRAWIAAVQQRLESFDALLLPTTPVIAPPLAALQNSEEAYFAANALLLRNPTFINFLDGCALSLPCHSPGTAPVGLMVAGTHGQDRHILAVGQTLQTLLQH